MADPVMPGPAKPRPKPFITLIDDRLATWDEATVTVDWVPAVVVSRGHDYVTASATHGWASNRLKTARG